MRAEFSRAVGKLIWPDTPRRALARYAVALILPLLCISLSVTFFNLSRAPFFVLFTLSILFAAVYGGWKPGVVCTLISVLLNAVLLPPNFSLRVTDKESLARLLIFGVAGLLISAFVDIIGSLQQKLDAQRERYRVTLASIGDAVIATDRDGRITFMNSVAEDTTGWSAELAHGRPLDEVFRVVDSSTRTVVHDVARQIFHSGHISGLAHFLIRNDGSEISIHHNATPIRDVRGKVVGAVLVFRDTTEQKLLDAALIRSEKLASVGRLATTIAHEINNPLEAIWNLLFLIRNSEDPNEMRHYIARAEHELSRVSEITKQTLSFAKREYEHEMVDVSEILDEVLVLFSNKVHTKNAAIRKECESPVFAFGTKSEVRQVLGNLIVNALDALTPEGSVQVRVRAITANGQPAARILVADTGHGIASEDMPKLFEAFFTRKKDVGTGLGLWVTKQIVDAHSGTIRVRSAVGKGTVVCIDWPAVDRRSRVEAKAAASVGE
ncbi:MAG TPA: ATP-binding protein [Terriglobales bacterium]